ncbi:MAG: arsenate reductase [Alteromonadaceae bacterium]|nr:MAG: arsenate reductase [Alteromonadaceae bacterium]
MTILYGIPNCDTVKKARNWLTQHDVAHVFHDFRKNGLELSHLKHWLEVLTVKSLINRRSTTWKQLSDEQKAMFDQDVLPDEALAIVLESPTLIKRPVLDNGVQLQLGFKPAEYAATFNK